MYFVSIVASHQKIVGAVHCHSIWLTIHWPSLNGLIGHRGYFVNGLLILLRDIKTLVEVACSQTTECDRSRTDDNISVDVHPVCVRLVDLDVWMAPAHNKHLVSKGCYSSNTSAAVWYCLSEFRRYQEVYSCIIYNENTHAFNRLV